MPASNNLSNTFFKFEVLLDIGSHTNAFSYLDGNNLGVEIGDIAVSYTHLTLPTICSV